MNVNHIAFLSIVMTEMLKIVIPFVYNELIKERKDFLISSKKKEFLTKKKENKIFALGTTVAIHLFNDFE